MAHAGPIRAVSEYQVDFLSGFFLMINPLECVLSVYSNSETGVAKLSRPRDGTMRFSQRTNWNTEESELARAHRLRQQAGLPIADLTASNPTRCGFPYTPELLAALNDPK